MKQDKPGSAGAVLQRRRQRRASIQWFAIGLLIALLLFATFLYLVSQERGGDDLPGSGRSSIRASNVALDW